MNSFRFNIHSDDEKTRRTKYLPRYLKNEMCNSRQNCSKELLQENIKIMKI